MKKNRLNWFYVPALFVVLAFIVYPLAYSIFLSFHKWNGYSSTKTWIGIGNYTKMFSDPDFWVAFRNTIIYGFVCTILQNILGLGLAIYLNTEFKGKNIVRTVIYLPVMVSSLIMGYIMYFFFQYNNGVANDILAIVGQSPVDWLANGTWAVIIITLVNVWQFVGVSMVIYLAGLQNIPQQLIEAAIVDGVSPWGAFIYIKLPLLVPAISSSVVYNLIGGLKLYDVIVALTAGGPSKRSNSLATYIANRYFDAERAGYAAAIGLFSFIFVMLVSTICNGYFRSKEVEQ